MLVVGQKYNIDGYDCICTYSGKGYKCLITSGELKGKQLSNLSETNSKIIKLN